MYTGQYDYQILQQLIALNQAVQQLLTFLAQWKTEVAAFFENILSFLPVALWCIVLFVGVHLVIKFFFPRWADV